MIFHQYKFLHILSRDMARSCGCAQSATHEKIFVRMLQTSSFCSDFTDIKICITVGNIPAEEGKRIWKVKWS
jgi:hypothetical protein